MTRGMKLAAMLISGACVVTACGDSESRDYGQMVMAGEARMLIQAWSGLPGAGVDTPEDACRTATMGAAKADTPQADLLRGMDLDDVIDGCVDALKR